MVDNLLQVRIHFSNKMAHSFIFAHEAIQKFNRYKNTDSIR